MARLFSDIDERYCSIFQKIKNNKVPEGIEIYFPFFFEKTSTFLEIFNDYNYIKYHDLSNNIKKYDDS